MLSGILHYEEQLRYIHQTAGQFPQHADEASGISLSADAKERIKQKLYGQLR